MAEKMNYVVYLMKGNQTIESYANCSPRKTACADENDENEFRLEVGDVLEGADLECVEASEKKEASSLTIEKASDQSWIFRSKKMGNFMVVVKDKNQKYEEFMVRLDFYVTDVDAQEKITPDLLIRKAYQEVERIKSNLSTVEGLIKVIDKKNNNAIKAIIKPTRGNDVPIVQIDQAYIDQYKEAEIVVDKELFKDYDFEHAYIGNLTSVKYPPYEKKVTELIDVDKKERGTKRLEYCFSVRTKIGACSFSFFYDNVNKELICIQSLETWLNSSVKVATVIGKKEVCYVTTPIFRVGRPHPIDGKETDHSIAELLTKTGRDEGSTIPQNKEETVEELKKILTENNNDLKAYLFAIPSSSMYNGKDATYPQAIVTEQGLQVLKSNTPVVLCINLGKKANLTKAKENDIIPNYILMQNNAFNNYYIHSNMNACNDQSNFAIFLSLY